MKANAPKRKVFADALDLLAQEETKGGVTSLPVNEIKTFHNHPFHLYEGERLEEMVASVKEHGVLYPVIVLKTEDGYEMLAGHNRQNAAKLAGLTEIPAIIKEGLSEQEAYVYVIETNMLQRSFFELSVSEKAAVLT
ncbi:Chromosome-partitioning protein Spo0J [Blautia producta]|uniref:Chromosome-partitioning protein Spo0J n=1 Tax=Blautia producta TaxID=33035 RepID=A0A4P6M0J6_9FIRM|nr:ParB N-terminal domain-containing protein [Blautia producta]QBE97976.1 Chromosome-partitioning protein Spo0J [Blautia producta]